MRKVGVHNGSHHADDAAGVAILKKLYPTLQIARTRDPELLASCDALVDVGGEYDPAKNKFDHHQLSFTLKRENGIPYAAAGLVWLTYGASFAHATRAMTEAEAAQVAKEVDERLIQHLDAVDNGIELPGFASVTLPYLVSDINATWLDSTDSDDSRFMDAVSLLIFVLTNTVKQVYADQKAHNEAAQSSVVHNGTILVVEKVRLPYDAYVIKNLPDVRVAVYPASNENGWQVRVIPIEEGKFEARMDLPSSWAGLRGSELAEVSGVADAIFCHKGRFIAAAESKEGALALAKKAVAIGIHKWKEFLMTPNAPTDVDALMATVDNVFEFIEKNGPEALSLAGLTSTTVSGEHLAALLRASSTWKNSVPYWDEALNVAREALERSGQNPSDALYGLI